MENEEQKKRFSDELQQGSGELGQREGRQRQTPRDGGQHVIGVAELQCGFVDIEMMVQDVLQHQPCLATNIDPPSVHTRSGQQQWSGCSPATGLDRGRQGAKTGYAVVTRGYSIFRCSAAS